MTSKDFCQYILDCLSKVGCFSVRAMMGEYCLYRDGKLVGLLCDNRLLVKQTETSKRLLADCALEYPYDGSKQEMFVIEDAENSEKMKELFDALMLELPEPKKKKPKEKRL